MLDIFFLFNYDVYTSNCGWEYKMDSSMQVPSCFCIKVRRIASALTRLYDNALAPCQITISQYSLLCHIRSLPKSSIRALSDATGLDRSTLARNLRQLLKKGWVEDARAPGARTVSYTHLDVYKRQGNGHRHAGFQATDGQRIGHVVAVEMCIRDRAKRLKRCVLTIYL